MLRYTNVGRDPEHEKLRASARHLLERGELKWRHHGIGVIQAYAVEDARIEHRLHIWSPKLIKEGIVGNGDVHDHRFDMLSHVLVGLVGHEEWNETLAPDGAYAMTDLTHARVAAHQKFDGETRRLEGYYDVRREAVTVPTGHMYAFDAQRFHRSIVQSGIAVTWVEKHNQREDIRARLLHRRDQEPVHAFGHDMDDTLVKELVKSAYVLLH